MLFFFIIFLIDQTNQDILVLSFISLYFFRILIIYLQEISITGSSQYGKDQIESKRFYALWNA